MRKFEFEWALDKEQDNIRKHNVDFYTAQFVFKDPKRKIFIDEKHSKKEKRSFCIGKVDGKVLTVRFTFRKNAIRIIGAGYWRKGVKYYEEN